MELKKTFGNVSKLYDSARESYPDELIKDIIKISKIKPKCNVLEIGCGSGIATRLFAQEQYKILAIDISKELIGIAKMKLSQFGNVSYQVTSFEDAMLKPQTFDLIISAQAWHWVDPDVGYSKAYNLLTENGYLALFWKVQEYNKSDFLKKVKSLFYRLCPDYHAPRAVRKARKFLKENKKFFTYEEKEYNLKLNVSKKRYLQRTETMSWISSLSEKDINIVLSKLSVLLEKYKEPLEIPYKYSLLIAKKKRI